MAELIDGAVQQAPQLGRHAKVGGSEIMGVGATVIADAPPGRSRVSQAQAPA
jgi:hypothetical protein